MIVVDEGIEHHGLSVPSTKIKKSQKLQLLYDTYNMGKKVMATYSTNNIERTNSNMLYTSTIIVIAVFLDLRWSFTRRWFVDWKLDCFIVV